MTARMTGPPDAALPGVCAIGAPQNSGVPL